jgi:hypothetical protein
MKHPSRHIMALCMEEARKGAAEGQYPVGPAVVTTNSAILSLEQDWIRAAAAPTPHRNPRNWETGSKTAVSPPAGLLPLHYASTLADVRGCRHLGQIGSRLRCAAKTALGIGFTPASEGFESTVSTVI